MGTWIVGFVVLAAAVLACVKLVRDKRAGKGCASCEGCSGDCGRRVGTGE